MEVDELIELTIHPVVPPKAESRMTHLGSKLFEPLKHLGVWAEGHREELEAIQARRRRAGRGQRG